MAILSTISAISIAIVLFLELRRDLMMFQQNSYRKERYMRWLQTSGDTTAISRLISYIILFCLLSTFKFGIFAIIATILFSIIRSWQLYSAKYKKPLAMTNRAKRILFVDIIITLIIVILSLVLFCNSISYDKILYTCATALVACYCGSHIITLLSNTILSPVEKHINDGFYKRAKEKLESMPGLKVIGITGSYGKTSTKHYLHRILSEHYDTLMTPGSFNTTLGVVRTINEYLKPYNEVFIVEMGAKQKGDIKEICDLVHPSISIVTAVGPQHLETFKSIDNVRDTKFEIVDCLPADGVAVINNDFEQIANRPVNNVKSIRYGVSNQTGCSYTAKNIKYSAHGTTFTVCNGNNEIELTTALVGECNISNLIAAVAVAIELGVPVDKIKYAVSKIEQVEHRLNLKRLPGGLTIIDDAFNSNPSGSRMALDVLSMMTEGKRFVITPGMIELGASQFELNEAFGRHMAHCADQAFIVGEYNQKAIIQGLEEEGMSSENIMTFGSFIEAYNHVLSIYTSGDTVLIENDLPDTFK
jgi:UDP-N-acetylmuramoyl-tripeptide--D-alanyl-D-alanine ligase